MRKPSSKAHGVRGGQRGEFAEGQPGGGVELQPRDVGFQCFQASETREKNRWLRVVGLGQDRLGPFKTDRLEVAAENGVGPREELTADIVPLAKVAPHADALAALPGKKESGLYHHLCRSDYVLLTTSARASAASGVLR